MESMERHETYPTQLIQIEDQYVNPRVLVKFSRLK